MSEEREEFSWELSALSRSGVRLAGNDRLRRRRRVGGGGISTVRFWRHCPKNIQHQ